MSSSSFRASNNEEERRLWIGNLDSRITEFKLLKIVQKCGQIDKFDMIFHKSGPLAGQARGYAFVTYKDSSGARVALDRLNGKMIGIKHIVVRLAKNINYDDVDNSKPRVEIPALGVGAANTGRMSKELTIKAIEAKLKALENHTDDLVINQTSNNDVPLIQRYQYNKNNNTQSSSTSGPMNRRYNSRHSSAPYNNRNQRHHKR